MSDPIPTLMRDSGMQGTPIIIGLENRKTVAATWGTSRTHRLQSRSERPLNLYLHDRAKCFEFALNGDLTGGAVYNLEQAWITAGSMLNGKEISVEVSRLTAVDEEGIHLLHRMTASGALLTAAYAPESEELLHSIGIPVLMPARRKKVTWRWRLRQLFGLLPGRTQ
jgi:hypothetical protein